MESVEYLCIVGNRVVIKGGPAMTTALIIGGVIVVGAFLVEGFVTMVNGALTDLFD